MLHQLKKLAVEAANGRDVKLEDEVCRLLLRHQGLLRRAPRGVQTLPQVRHRQEETRLPRPKRNGQEETRPSQEIQNVRQEDARVRSVGQARLAEEPNSSSLRIEAVPSADLQGQGDRQQQRQGEVRRGHGEDLARRGHHLREALRRHGLSRVLGFALPALLQEPRLR